MQTGWQNQGYAWYIVPRTYSEKVGLIDWGNQFFDKNFLNVVELVEKQRIMKDFQRNVAKEKSDL